MKSYYYHSTKILVLLQDNFLWGKKWVRFYNTIKTKNEPFNSKFTFLIFFFYGFRIWARIVDWKTTRNNEKTWWGWKTGVLSSKSALPQLSFFFTFLLAQISALPFIPPKAFSSSWGFNHNVCEMLNNKYLCSPIYVPYLENVMFQHLW